MPESLRSRQASWTVPVPSLANPAAVSVPAGPHVASAGWIHSMVAVGVDAGAQVMVLGLLMSAWDEDELPKRTVRLCGRPSMRLDGIDQVKP